MRLKDRVAIITGGGRGIGRATAELFAREGAKVVVADMEIEVARETTQAIGPAAMAVQVNVTDRESVQAMVEHTLEKLKRIDILVNNAGVIRDAQLLKMSPEDFDFVVDVNLKGVFNCTQAIVPTMVEQGKGVVLNASSVVGIYGNFGQTNYVATKSGVIGMTRTWARELGRKGIRVNAVAPGFIETRMTEGIPDKVMDQLKARVPLGRMGKPEEIANAYLWLASDESSYVTGHILSVDGGALP
ncbi:MAG: 3-oxoacyl-[acyl-carrier-protein] reductase [Vulcanimicrobiota bacterium]